jgi:hypothetical protein
MMRSAPAKQDETSTVKEVKKEGEEDNKYLEDGFQFS